MAKKVQSADILPPTSSSSDGSGSSSEDDQQSQKPLIQSDYESDDETQPLSEPVVSSHQPQESEDESDDDTQNSPSASAFTVMPIIQTPTKGGVKGVNGKRPAEVEIAKVSKSKKSKGLNGEALSGQVEEKKSLLKWSEKDEYVLLGGIFHFKAKTGEDVNFKMDDFYEFAKDLFSVSLTKSQLYEKIRRLKKKFLSNVEKGQNGEELVFLKTHESKLFDLSKKIWGSEGASATQGNASKVKSSKKKDNKDGDVVSDTNTSTVLKPVTSREQEEIKDASIEDKKEETRDFWSLYPWLCASFESEASNLKQKPGNLKDYVERLMLCLSTSNIKILKKRGINAKQVNEVMVDEDV
ncbi:hypothetical protein POM88_029599 [Heracleum sosnowskyi]|uniref:Glabrous enhancer-binding protein-like DBD domain-containing protein n=1 Tax=Heracleum sosnowskyi TaxID=360622 RepID=A0AAD8HV64_9APIA|nr:hypothetical protein POM88_029599 [Heracleum sosnowskyi]